MGAGLQGGLEQLKIGNGELLRATCWASRERRRVKETRRQVTEYTETRGRRGRRTHTHTHTQLARDNGGELAERMGTRCEQLGVLPRERGEGVCPLEAGHNQADSVVPREVEGRSAADGCTRSLGGMKAPGALVVARIPARVWSRCVWLRVWSWCVWCRGACSPVCLNACCNARIPGV